MVDTSIHTSGSTWLELFLLFTIRGGYTTAQQIPGAEGNHIKPKFNALFKAFIKRSKQLLFFASPQDKSPPSKLGPGPFAHMASPLSWP